MRAAAGACVPAVEQFLARGASKEVTNADGTTAKSKAAAEACVALLVMQWEPGSGNLALHSDDDDDDDGQPGAALSTMPLGAGPPSDAVHPVAATDEHIIDAAYDAVGTANPEILTAPLVPAGPITKKIKDWLSQRGHDRLAGRINKNAVRRRLVRRRQHKTLVLHK